MQSSVNLNKSMKWMISLGGDGLFTLLLSNMVIMLTAGFTLSWSLLRVVSVARTAQISAGHDSVLMVLGMRLEGNKITRDYSMRLDRAINLFNAARQRGKHHNILVVGGRTNGSRISEASCGREFLISRGIPQERVQIEDASCHTLDNLRNARAIMMKADISAVTMITNRYHLARSMIIAKGLGMTPYPCAAEDGFNVAINDIPRLLLEGYYIHWYYTGMIWSRVMRNKKSIDKIS